MGAQLEIPKFKVHRSGPIWSSRWSYPAPTSSANKGHEQERHVSSQNKIATSSRPLPQTGTVHELSQCVVVGMGVEIIYKLQYEVRVSGASCSASLKETPIMNVIDGTIYHHSVYQIENILLPDIEGLLQMEGLQAADRARLLGARKRWGTILRQYGKGAAVPTVDLLGAGSAVGQAIQHANWMSMKYRADSSDMYDTLMRNYGEIYSSNSGGFGKGLGAAWTGAILGSPGHAFGADVVRLVKGLVSPGKVLRTTTKDAVIAMQAATIGSGSTFYEGALDGKGGVNTGPFSVPLASP